MSARVIEFGEFGLKPPRDEFAENNLISWGIDPEKLARGTKDAGCLAPLYPVNF